jgi:hypothetical protein
MLKKDESQKPTPEMLAAVVNYVGPIKKIPEGKRTRRGPSKKAGESGSWRHEDWSDNLDRLAWGS